jgi:hypothetical protein
MVKLDACYLKTADELRSVKKGKYELRPKILGMQLVHFNQVLLNN